ncbi:hypothetical protein LUZ60_011554 [Juncus effusus]|nr:hypothetical protein LUZ60_011554 [Juncus effusus]
MSTDKMPVGFNFSPTDFELLNYYLKRKITGLAIHLERELIPEVDVYKCDPWDLPDDNSGEILYFFTPKDKKYSSGSESNRATMSGYWKAIGKDRVVISPSSQQNIIGMIKTLVFHKGRAPQVERTDWLMHEYRTMAPELESRNKVHIFFSRSFLVLVLVISLNGFFLGMYRVVMFFANYLES